MSAPSDAVRIEVPLSKAEAVALAQFLKRIGWNEIRVNALDDSDAYVMRDALRHVQMALVDQGYAPR